MRGFELIAAAAIPFLAGYSGNSLYLTLAVGFLGLLVAVAAGLLSLNQFQERWVEYRTTSEALKREKYLFLTKADPYDGDHPSPYSWSALRILSRKRPAHGGQYMRPVGKAKTLKRRAVRRPRRRKCSGPK